jgi:hypothetical protein
VGWVEGRVGRSGGGFDGGVKSGRKKTEGRGGMVVLVVGVQQSRSIPMHGRRDSRGWTERRVVRMMRSAVVQ